MRIAATIVMGIATVACGVGGLMAVLFGILHRGDALETGSMRVLMMGTGITLVLCAAAGVYGLLRLWRR